MSIRIPLYRLDELKFWQRHAKSGSIDLSNVDLTVQALYPRAACPQKCCKKLRDVIIKLEPEDDVVHTNQTIKDKTVLIHIPSAVEMPSTKVPGTKIDSARSKAVKPKISFLFEEDVPNLPSEDTYKEQHDVQDNSTCCVCHSADRSLDVLGEYSNIFRRICGDVCCVDTDLFLLCWECRALLKNAQRFQKRVHLSQQIFTSAKRKCLSTITIKSLPTYVCYEPVKREIEELEGKNEDDIRDVDLEHNHEEFDVPLQSIEDLIEFGNCHAFDDDDDRVDLLTKQKKTVKNKKYKINVDEVTKVDDKILSVKRTEDELNNYHVVDDYDNNDDQNDKVKSKQSKITNKIFKNNGNMTKENYEINHSAADNDELIFKLASKPSELTIEKSKNDGDGVMAENDKINQSAPLRTKGEWNYSCAFYDKDKIVPLVSTRSKIQCRINKDNTTKKNDKINQVAAADNDKNYQPAAMQSELIIKKKKAKNDDYGVTVKVNNKIVMKEKDKLNQLADDSNGDDIINQLAALQTGLTIKKKPLKNYSNSLTEGENETNQLAAKRTEDEWDDCHAFFDDDDDDEDSMVQPAAEPLKPVAKKKNCENNAKKESKGYDKVNIVAKGSISKNNKKIQGVTPIENEIDKATVKSKFFLDKCPRSLNETKLKQNKENIEVNKNEISKFCRVVVNSGQNEYQCLQCVKKLSTMELFREHYLELHDKFTCDYCGENFQFKIQVEVHIERNHMIVCKTCGATYKNYKSLKHHIRLRHTVSRGDSSYCVQCDKQFDNEQQLLRHVHRSSKHKAERKNKKVSKREHKCPECPKVYQTRQGFKLHYNFVHKKIRCICEHCGKAFQSNAKREEHVKTKHEGYKLPKDNICDICGEGFATAFTLENHMVRHSGLRPHACPLCDKRFTQLVAMQRHVRNVHEGIPQRKYKKKT